MSVVVAIKDKNRIVMGCDSQVSYGGLKSKLGPNECKIFDVKNCDGGYMGCVGSVRDMQILSVQPNLIDEIAILKNQINYEYCVANLFINIYNVLQKYNRIDKNQNGELANYINTSLIFAYKNKAWLLDHEGCIMEIQDYLVCGSGSEVAMGSLDNTKGKSAEDRIVEAIKACNKNTLYVDNNIVLVSTK